MDERAKELIKQGDHLFDKRVPLLSLWQEIADNFYPERAEFTVIRSLGDGFADHLTSSYPLLCRRELGNALSSMLRPNSKDWFSMRTARPEREDKQGNAWLEWAGGLQKRAMYDRAAGLARAAKEADHDFATFGQAPMTMEVNPKINALLYRTWHLRDVVWCEDETGSIDTVHRKWKPTARELIRLFGDKVHAKVKEKNDKDPYFEFECRHIVIPAAYYTPATEGGKKPMQPFVSIFVDVENGHIMEEVGSWTRKYIIPRWQTISGSQYAHSPATIAALPDGRLIQSMSYALLQAGEKAATPPMIATREVVRSDLQLFAGGTTWVDAEYDERLGEALRPITQDTSGIRYGLEMQRDTREMISQAFLLNKLTMPPPEKEMTAFEVGQRVQEYIRQAMPIFEPMEAEYNGQLCEMTFEELLRAGAFGGAEDMPESLRGAEVQFKFESPLNEAIDRVKGQRFREGAELLSIALQFDPGAGALVDARTALRDALEGIGVPAKWGRDEKEVAALEQAQEKAKQQAVAMQTASAASEIAMNAGRASKDFAAARATPDAVAA